MSNVINLAEIKCRNRKAFLAKHGRRLDSFVERFVNVNLAIDFRQLAQDYYQNSDSVSDAAWDYVHFREILAEALDRAFGDILYAMLREQSWFDPKQISKDEVIDRCLVTYIINQCQYALTV